MVPTVFSVVYFSRTLPRPKFRGDKFGHQLLRELGNEPRDSRNERKPVGWFSSAHSIFVLIVFVLFVLFFFGWFAFCFLCCFFKANQPKRTHLCSPRSLESRVVASRRQRSAAAQVGPQAPALVDVAALDLGVSESRCGRAHERTRRGR